MQYTFKLKVADFGYTPNQPVCVLDLMSSVDMTTDEMLVNQKVVLGHSGKVTACYAVLKRHQLNTYECFFNSVAYLTL